MGGALGDEPASSFRALSGYNPLFCDAVPSSSMDCTSCTQQLWAMPPIGAAWTESMHLGAELHDDAKDQYCRDVELNCVRIAQEFSICLQELRIMGDTVCKLRAENENLEQELSDVRGQLERIQRERKELEEQEALAKSIWGPIARLPDASWDTAPVLLSADPMDQPVSISRITSDLGFKNSAEHIHRLTGFVRQAFSVAKRPLTGPRVYYDSGGIPERLSCYTERDRDIITAVVLQHGVR
jgi:hypothetical protein